MEARAALPTSARLARGLARQIGEPAFDPRGPWAAPEALASLADSPLATPFRAHRLGRELVAPSQIGVELRRAGIGSPEKAFRRCDTLLAREREGDRYEVAQLRRSGARVRFVPQGGRKPNPFFCRVREGMLAGLPQALGLPEAGVRERRCAGQGAPACEFEVVFRHGRRRALRWGLGVGGAAGGLLLAGGVALAGGGAPSLALWIAGALATGSGAACAVAIDAGQRLRAAEAARGEAPALLEQAERALAEKVDELARFERATPSVAGRVSAAAELDADHELVGQAARELHGSVAALQRSLVSLHQRVVQRRGWTHEELERLIERCVDEARQIHGIGARLAQSGGDSVAHRVPGDLGATVAQVVDGFRARHAEGALSVALERPESLSRVAFEPYQVELVVSELLDNAFEALSGRGGIQVTVREEPAVVEVAVSDDGPGIQDQVLDQLFDPFFAQAVPPTDGDGTGPALGRTPGTGLSLCYRIVKEHGGEMRVESASERGTTVTLAMPKTLGNAQDGV